MAWVAEHRTRILAEWVAQNPSLIPAYTSSRRFNSNFRHRKGTTKAQERGLRNSTASPIRRHLHRWPIHRHRYGTGRIPSWREREREKLPLFCACVGPIAHLPHAGLKHANRKKIATSPRYLCN